MAAKRLHIAFVSPKGPLYRHNGGIFKKSLRPAPITFSTLAAHVPPELDCTFDVYDEGVEEVDAEHISADVIAMTAITGSAPRAYELAQRFMARGIPVVLGGPHVTLAPEDALGKVDSVVTGYAEETWPELLRDLVRGELKPRYEMAPDFAFDKLESLPFPRRDIMRSAGYRTLNTFEATRGCVHACDFCVVPAAWGRKPYLKPIDHVVEDIRQMGAKKVVFYDLNIIADKKHAKQLFEALIPLRIQWYGLATALIGRDSELLELAARSGCRGLLVGFESVAPDSLGKVHKRMNDPTRYRQFVDDLQRLGIAINGTFTFGTDADTPDTFAAVREFVMSHRIELPRFSILTPFPGTPMYKRIKGEGRLLHEDWSLYDGQHVVYEPKQMSPEELLEHHKATWKAVYGRRAIFHRLWGKKNLPLLIGANWGYRFYAHRLDSFYTCQGGHV